MLYITKLDVQKARDAASRRLIRAGIYLAMLERKRLAAAAAKENEKREKKIQLLGCFSFLRAGAASDLIDSVSVAVEAG